MSVFHAGAFLIYVDAQGHTYAGPLGTPEPVEGEKPSPVWVQFGPSRPAPERTINRVTSGVGP